MLIVFRNMKNLMSTLGPLEERSVNFNADNISTGICAADCFWCFDHLCYNPHWGLSQSMFCKILQLLLVLGFGIWICKYHIHFSLIRLFLPGSLFTHTIQEENISEFTGQVHCFRCQYGSPLLPMENMFWDHQWMPETVIVLILCIQYFFLCIRTFSPKGSTWQLLFGTYKSICLCFGDHAK